METKEQKHKYNMTYIQRHPERYEQQKQRCLERYYIRKQKALDIISKGKVECSNCGCKNMRILEINHINGNVGIMKKRRDNKEDLVNLINRIVSGNRTTDDLNILCKVCNIAEYVKRKHNIEFEIRLR